MNRDTDLKASTTIQTFLKAHDCFTIGNYHVNKKKIGIGSFATIYHGIEKDIGLEVAIKRIHVKDIHKISPIITKEIEIMKELKHPNIVMMYDVIYEKDFDNVNIIMEYAPIGNLSDHMKKENIVGEIYGKFFMRQIAKGLKYLLSKNIVHRDLKPQNILMFHGNIVKIADFGLAKSFQGDQQFNTLCGSPLYMAPEIVVPMTNKTNIKNIKNIDRSYTTKADLWSVGIILYEMLCGKLPIYPKSLYHLPQLMKESDYKLPINIIVSNECRDILSKLLIKEPSKRIEWNEFFRHDWFLINEIEEQERIKMINDNQILEMADKIIMDDQQSRNIKYNTPNKIKNNKLDKLKFELNSTQYHESVNNTPISIHSIQSKSELSQLHNSLQEFKKSITKSPSSNIKEKNDIIKDEDLFMSCEEKNEKEVEMDVEMEEEEGEEIEEVDDDVLSKKLDLIINQINELKELKSIRSNNSPKLVKKKFNNRTRNTSESSTMFDIDIDSGSDNNFHLINSSDIKKKSFSELDDEQHETSVLIEKKNPLYNGDDSFIIISSKPINIDIKNEQKIKSSNVEGVSPLQTSLKNYITHSFNLIKESANYLSGNYKSI